MKNEAKLARDLLRARKNGFPSPWISIVGKKVHFIRYAAIAFIVIMLSTNWSDVEFRGVFLFFTGIFLGGIIKEMAFYKKIGDHWPFTEKVTDWALVARLAGEENEIAGQESTSQK